MDSAGRVGIGLGKQNMVPSEKDFVWYAAFGSNLSRARFLAYLRGGVVAGSSKVGGEIGARDPSQPRSEDWRWFDHRLFFAYQSQRWHRGGVAFMDLRRGSGRTISRLYKITRGQFEDVHRQEVRAETVVALDVDTLVDAGEIQVYDKLYGLALYLGAHRDGDPIITITTSCSLPPNAPAPEYLLTMVRGLREGSGLTDSKIVAYLAAVSGMEDAYSEARIGELLVASTDAPAAKDQPG